MRVAIDNLATNWDEFLDVLRRDGKAHRIEAGYSYDRDFFAECKQMDTPALGSASRFV
jgi:hypothetical protein